MDFTVPFSVRVNRPRNILVVNPDKPPMQFFKALHRC